MMPSLNLRLTNVSLAWLFCFFTVLSAAFIIFWDEPLAWYFEINIGKELHTLLGLITELANGVIWFGLAASGYATCRLIASRTTAEKKRSLYLRYVRAWTYMLVSMTAAAAILNGLKFAIGRYRPRYLFNDDLFGFEPFGLALKMASFPSGHAQSIWSAMIALCFLTPRFSPLYVIIALMVSASRFLTAVHFVSDVVFGAFISIAVAVLIRRWFEKGGQSLHLEPSRH